MARVVIRNRLVDEKDLFICECINLEAVLVKHEVHCLVTHIYDFSKAVLLALHPPALDHLAVSYFKLSKAVPEAF